MKRITTTLLFPYFAPLMLLSIVAFAYMLATPHKASDGTGPAGGDVLGVFFIVLCFILGGVMQLIIGLPLNLIISRTRSFFLRLIVCIVASLIPVIIYVPIMLDTPSTPIEDAFGFAIVLFTFGAGSWLIFSQLSPTNNKPNKSKHPTANRSRDAEVNHE